VSVLNELRDAWPDCEFVGLDVMFADGVIETVCVFVTVGDNEVDTVSVADALFVFVGLFVFVFVILAVDVGVCD